MHDQQQDADYDTTTTRQRTITGRPRRDAQVDALIAGLLQGLTVQQAAEAANLARSTAYELLQHPDVQDRLRQARGEALAAAARTAAGLATEAVGVLADLMRNADGEGVRRLAADSLLAHAAALGRDQDTEQRIADLTTQLDAMLGGADGGAARDDGGSDAARTAGGAPRGASASACRRPGACPCVRGR